MKSTDKLSEIEARIDKLLKDETIKDNLLKQNLQKAIEIIKEAFQCYTSEELFVSFNGGKDSALLLFLVRYCVDNFNYSMPRVLYIDKGDNFVEINEYIESFNSLILPNCDEHFIQTTGDIKRGLEKILREYSNLKASFIGLRSTDPFCSQLTFFTPTDNGWPPLMRITPLLYFSNNQLWKIVRYINLPYCCLYDQGYTSIGGTKDTRKNPTLEIRDPKTNKIVGYRPAYEMVDEETERAGRSTT